VSDLKDKS